MIIGLGTDIVHIPRIADALGRWGQRFLDRVFTPEEQEYCLRQRQPEQGLALRFAAKEACSKALGTGMRKGVIWRQIAVGREASGKPFLQLSGRALKRAQDLRVTSSHVSLSHEKDYGVAVVVLTAE